MNPENHKAIAEIINNNFFYEDGTKRTADVEELTSDLADYFEETAFKGFNKEGKVVSDFNRPQFLKDCGVTK